MKKFFVVCMTLVSLLLCSSGFAKEPSLLDLDPEFLDFLPWDVQTGEWKDGRDKKPDDGITGENPEKERQQEEAMGQKPAEDVKPEPAEPLKQEMDGKQVEVKSIDVIMIIDKSGSMYNMRVDTIGGFNSFLEEQKKKEVPVRVSVGFFNQVLENKLDRVELKDVTNLNENDYVPQGTTAMLDAVGNTLSAFKAREEVNAAGNKVLVVIITDGMENASKEWTWSSVRDLIRDLREKHGYEFVFLGANIDSEQTAENMGIEREAAVKYKQTSGVDGGVQSNFKAMNIMMETVSAGNSLVSDTKWKRSIVEDK